MLGTMLVTKRATDTDCKKLERSLAFPMGRHVEEELKSISEEKMV